MGVFLWHDRRQALCLAVIAKEKMLIVIWKWTQGPTNIQGERYCFKVLGGVKGL